MCSADYLIKHTENTHPDESTVRRPHVPFPKALPGHRSSSEFVPHPTISQDRTRSKDRDEAQLLVLQLQRKTGQTLRWDRDRTAAGGLASATDDGFGFLDKDAPPLTEDALNQAFREDGDAEDPMYGTKGERNDYPTIVDETEWDEDGQRLDAMDVASQASSVSGDNRASNTFPPWARIGGNPNFPETNPRPARPPRYASDRRNGSVVRFHPPSPSRARISVTNRTDSKRRRRSTDVRKENREEDYPRGESPIYLLHTTEDTMAGVEAAEMLSNPRSREDRSISSPVIRPDGPAARIQRSFIEIEDLQSCVPARHPEAPSPFGRERDEHDRPSRSSNRNDTHDRKSSPVPEKDLETQIHELKAQLRSLELLRPAPPWQWQVIHRVKNRRGMRPTRRDPRRRYRGAHEPNDDRDRHRSSGDSSDDSGELFIRNDRRNDETDGHYLDAPRWPPVGSKQSELECTMPVSNIDSYIDRRPELAFIVFRDYDANKSEAEHHTSTNVDRKKYTTNRMLLPTLSLC